MYIKGCSFDVVHNMTGLFEPRIFLDGDALAIEGMHGKEFYVIERGFVEVHAKLLILHCLRYD